MKTLNRCGALAIVICAAGGNALADPPKDSDDPSESCPNDNAPQACPQPAPPPAPPPMAQPAPEVSMAAPPVEEPSWFERAGFAIAAGGGVADFAGEAMREATSIGGNWVVRATLGSKQYLAIEAAYIGSAQDINVLGLNSSATLVGNGAEADLRLNLTSNYPVQPFIFGGAAWRHYTLSNITFNTSDINNHDDVFEVPAGLGIAGHFDGFIADVRGEYRFGFGDDLIPNVSSLARWGVTGTLGYEF